MANIQSIITNGNGNVLINTTTDNGDKLQVSGNTTINGSLYLRGGSRYIVGDGGDLYIDTENVAGRDLLLQTQSGQNVGIGTTSPGAKLDVNGEVYVSPNTAGKNTFVLTTNASNDGRLLIKSDTTTNVDIQANGTTYFNGGNVAIGTTTAATKLTVNSGSTVAASRFTNTTTGLDFILGTDGVQSQYTNIVFYSDSGNAQIWKAGSGYSSQGGASSLNIYNSNGAIAFHPNSVNNAMFINTSGNVGIGTTAPGAKLALGHIANQNGVLNYTLAVTGESSLFQSYADISVSGFPRVLDIVAGSGDTGGTAAGSIIRFLTSSGAGASATSEKVRITSAGNVGIGTVSPQGLLQIGANSLFDNSDASNAFNLKQTSTTAATGIYLERSGERKGYYIYVGGSADSLTFQRNNSGTKADVMALTRDGNVGIGTTAPAQKLHVVGNTYITDTLTVDCSSGNTLVLRKGTGAGALALAGTSDQASALIEGVSGGGLNIYTSNGGTLGTPGWSSKMYITAAGNVGIGTTSPANKLEVSVLGYGFRHYGDASNYLRTYVGSNYQILDNGTNQFGYFNGKFYVQTGGADKLTIDTSGNVGIGTTSPGYTLQVGSTSANSSMAIIGNSTAGIEVRTNSAGGRIAALEQYFGNEGSLWLYLSNTAKVLLRADGNSYLNGGNVGIGTTSPAAKLDVQTSSTNLGLRLGNINGTNWDFYSYNDSNLYINNTGGTVFTILNSNGNVGIGTASPSEKLHVDGNAVLTYNNSYQGINSVGNKAILARVSPTTGIINYAEYATAANLNGFVMGSDDARVKGNIATDSLEFITNGSTRMTVLSSGNVGVNTTTPGTNFHVVGDVLIQTGALGVGVNPNATDGRIDASNDIVAYSSSDRRLKENITPIANALDKVKSLTGVEFDWKPEHKKAHGYEGHDTGVIAQEVQEVMPTAVRTNDTGYLAVRYEKMIGLLIEAMKEQQTQIDELKAKLDGLTK